jgi:hypothetical protein
MPAIVARRVFLTTVIAVAFEFLTMTPCHFQSSHLYLCGICARQGDLVACAARLTKMAGAPRRLVQGAYAA